MSQYDKGILAAAMVTLERGASGTQDARLIGDNQASWLVNTTVRGGFPHNRPGWKQIELSYDSEGDQAAVEGGRFQGAAFFQPRTGAPCLVASISGRQWRFNIWSDNSVQEVTIGDLNPRTATTANYTQPIVGGTVNVTVANSSGAYLGQSIVIAGGGIYTVTAIPDGTHITLQNTGVLSVVATTIVTSGAVVTPQSYDPNQPNILQVWFVQAEDFLIMQDGSSRPWCYNGATARRLDIGELPTGCMMVYALGRIGVTLPDRLSFVFGDLVGSSSGTPGYAYRDAVLKMTENIYLNEGGAFAVPANAGLINAMQYVPNLDTSLGQGPIEIFTDNGAFSVNIPFDRTTWKNLTYPIQTVSLAAPGALSQWSTVRVNGDLWYRAFDGIRSFIVARRDFGMWGNVPMSDEVEKRLLAYDTEWLLPWSSGIQFDNRLMMTATPVWNATHGVAHRALAVIDFDLISSLGQRTQPCWEGMWTGLDVLQLLTGERNKVQRGLAFVLGKDLSPVTTTTASFVQPAVSANVIVTMEDTTGAYIGQQLHIEGAGEYIVAVVTSPTQLELTLVSGTAAGITITSGAEVEPSALKIQLWEMLTASLYDQPVNSPALRIKWGGETKLFDYGQPNTLKSLERADLAPSAIQGQVNFETQFRSDENPCWLDWSDFVVCAQDSDCEPTDCWTPDIYNKTYRTRVTLPTPPQSCETPPNKPSQLGYRHQLRWTVLGPCSMKQLVLYARDVQQAPFDGCPPTAVVCSTDICCPPDNYFQSEV